LTAVEVVAGILPVGGRFLLTQRPEGTHLAGRWEFPGGKRQPGESRQAALVREWREELDLAVCPVRYLGRFPHTYPDRGAVVLHAFAAVAVAGTPRPLAAAAIGWFRPDELLALAWPEADLPLVRALARLPRAEDVLALGADAAEGEA